MTYIFVSEAVVKELQALLAPEPVPNNYYGTKWNAGQPVLCDSYGYPLPPSALTYGGEPPVIPIDRPSDTEAPIQEETTETEFQYILRKWREFAKAEGRQVP